jgi:HlyD family secretion protein
MDSVLNSLKALLLLMFSALFVSCNNNGNEADAYGNFEAEEVIVSAQTQGEIVSLNVTEGTLVEMGKIIGRIDSVPAGIKKSQLVAQQSVISARLGNIDAQLKVQQEQRINLAREVERSGNLLADNAVTQQQYDDISGKLKVLDSQTDAIKSQRNIIFGEQSVLKAQMEEADNMLSRTRIASPVSGTILEKYVDAGELVTPGKALFKVANLEVMELKVFISGSQLSEIATGDSVGVLIDAPGEMKRMKGFVSWISAQVEFTPKIIQTREERVNMVYAVKVRVKNDGSLKIGMPGEVTWSDL